MSQPVQDTPTDPLSALVGANMPETAQDMRKLLDGFAPMLNADPPEVGAIHERVPVEGAAPGVTANVLVPRGEGPFPVLVYLHGGGWVCGSPTTHHKLGLRFAEAGYLVYNVDYRLAPENPFPAPLEDCVEAIRWASKTAADHGGDRARLAIGGDSAGGNLSAAAAIALAEDPDVTIRAALLIYGVFDFARLAAIEVPQVQTSEAMIEAGRKLTEMMTSSYLGAERSASLLADPRVSPIHAAAKLPPSHIVCGAEDPLAEQTRTLAERLEKARVEHEAVIVPGMPHGFAQMEFFPQAREAIAKMTAFLDRALG